MEATPIQVLLAEDDPFVHRAMTRYLEGASGIELIGIGADGHSALALAHDLHPDVAIVDIHLPGMDGVELTAALCAAPLQCRVVCYTALADDQTLRRALAAGASGFMIKTDSPGLVLHAIRSAYSGDALVSPKLLVRLLQHSLERSTPPESLSTRDLQLVKLIGDGLSNADIAEVMHLAPNTIKTYVSRLLARLDTPNRTSIARLAYQWRLSAQ